MKIISELTGGFGNQLFAYATAYAIARENGGELYINTYMSDNGMTRELGIDKLNIEYKKRLTYKYKKNIVSRVIFNKIRRANQPLNNIPDEWVNLILDQIVNLKSIKSIKKELNSYNAGLQKASEFNVLNINTLDANFKSVNDTQIYYLLDKYMDYKRFVMIDVDTPNMKNETENSQADKDSE